MGRRGVGERFWSKVDAAGICWEWTASRTGSGYGKFWAEPGRTMQAHRISWELLVGDIPEGMELDHLCLNYLCVNPDHLEPVTHLVNVRRGTHNRGSTDKFCAAGHEFTAENTRYRNNKGWKICRKCDSLRALAYRKRKRGNHTAH